MEATRAKTPYLRRLFATRLASIIVENAVVARAAASPTYAEERGAVNMAVEKSKKEVGSVNSIDTAG